MNMLCAFSLPLEHTHSIERGASRPSLRKHNIRRDLWGGVMPMPWLLLRVSSSTFYSLCAFSWVSEKGSWCAFVLSAFWKFFLFFLFFNCHHYIPPFFLSIWFHVFVPFHDFSWVGSLGFAFVFPAPKNREQPICWKPVSLLKGHFIRW